MDILLTGLRQAAPGDFVLEQSSGEQYIAPDLSYADDLITLSSTREAIQVKAEVVSAMAICLGLDIAVTKFRTCAMVPGKSPPPLQVYTKGWVRQEVPFQTDGFIKYLGSKQDLDGTSSADMKAILEYLQDTARRLSTNLAASALHRTYIHGAVIPKVAYAGMFITGSLKKIMKLDGPMTGLIKRKNNLAASWPTELLYHPLGMAMNRISDTIQLGKLRMFTKPSDRATEMAIDSIFDRHARRLPSYMTGPWQVAGKSDDEHWIGSLLEFLAIGGQSLARPFNQATNILDRPITDISPSWIPSPDLPIDRIGDLVSLYEDKLYIKPPHYFSQYGQALNAALWHTWRLDDTRLADKDGFPSSTPLYVRKGQHWFHQDANGSLTRGICITGWTNSGVLGFSLEHSSRPYRTTQALRIIRQGRVEVPWDVFLTLNTKGIVTTTHDPHLRYIMPVYPARREMLLPRGDLIPDTPLGSIICTDGSHATRYLGPCPHQCQFVAGAGVVVVAPDRTVVAKFHFNSYAQSEGRAFTQEMMAAGIGGLLAQSANLTSPVYTDCQSAIMVRPSTAYTRAYTQQAAVLKQYPLEWVRGHADTRLSEPNWSLAQYGNIQADKVADGRMQPDPSPFGWSGSQMLRQAARGLNRVIVQDSEGGLALLETRATVSTIRLEAYLKQRSEEYNGEWSADSLRMLMKSGLTSKQRGARLKLHLARFDIDRIDRAHRSDPSIPPPKLCSCGCYNTLSQWITTCTEPRTVERFKLARVRIATMLRNERPIEELVTGLLAGPNQILLWRANWQKEHMEQLGRCYDQVWMNARRWRGAQRALVAITSELISASLDAHGYRRAPKVTFLQRCKGTRPPTRSRLEAVWERTRDMSHVIGSYFRDSRGQLAPMSTLPSLRLELPVPIRKLSKQKEDAMLPKISDIFVTIRPAARPAATTLQSRRKSTYTSTTITSSTPSVLPYFRVAAASAVSTNTSLIPVDLSVCNVMTMQQHGHILTPAVMYDDMSICTPPSTNAHNTNPSAPATPIMNEPYTSAHLTNHTVSVTPYAHYLTMKLMNATLTPGTLPADTTARMFPPLTHPPVTSYEYMFSGRTSGTNWSVPPGEMLLSPPIVPSTILYTPTTVMHHPVCTPHPIHVVPNPFAIYNYSSSSLPSKQVGAIIPRAPRGDHDRPP
jgi:hypothetical protein